MNDINLLVEKLQNAVQSENSVSDWGYIKCYLEVMSYPSFNGGAIYLYKKDNIELLCFIPKNHYEIWSPIAEYMHSQKKNKYNLIIYPSGEYESEFIWDNEAHINSLILSLNAFFDFIREEICNKVAKKFPSQVLWENITTTIPFKLDKVQPINIEIKRGESITNHSMLIQNICYQEDLYLIQRIEEIYHLTNEGELKSQLSEKWNTVILNISAGVYFDFYRDVKFEWREENA